MEGEQKELEQQEAELELRYKELAHQLSQAQQTKQTNQRTRKMEEAIESLKKHHPNSVFGKLIDLCEPRFVLFN